MRKRVQDWDGKEDSLCPSCNSLLLSRRGDIVRWHWAHYPEAYRRSGCPYHESVWHLSWKQVYLGLGWSIEWPLVIGTKRYIIDAINPKTKRIREFVHSYSLQYTDKHYALWNAGFNVLWIFDGEEHTSLRAKEVKRGGMKNFLKPRAYELAEDLHVLVHTLSPPLFWKEWKENIWFPQNGQIGQKLLQSFSDISKEKSRHG